MILLGIVYKLVQNMHSSLNSRYQATIPLYYHNFIKAASSSWIWEYQKLLTVWHWIMLVKFLDWKPVASYPNHVVGVVLCLLREFCFLLLFSKINYLVLCSSCSNNDLLVKILQFYLEMRFFIQYQSNSLDRFWQSFRWLILFFFLVVN